jgi:hypothetical protein
MTVTQWEYRVVTAGSTFSQPKDDDLETMLNELGSEGWEVVAVHNQEGTNKVRIVAKRQVAGRPKRVPTWP